MLTCPTIFLFPESEDVPAAPLSDPGGAGRKDTHEEIVPGYASSGLFKRLLGFGSTEEAAKNLEVEIPKRTAGMLQFASLMFICIF